MKYLFITIAIIMLIAGPVLSDETGGKIGAGAKGGGTFYWGDISGTDLWSYYDFYATWWVSDYIGLGFNYGKGFLSATEEVENVEKYFKTCIWNYTFLLKFKLLPSSSFNPYFTVGYEITDINPKNRDGSLATNRANGVYEKINYAIPLGVGFGYFLSENFAIDLEALYHHSGTDYLDDLEEGDKNDGFVTVALGLSFNIGKAKDSDGDGIPDKQDKDPLHKEDFDGFQDEDGVPDFDNDQDGVPDNMDKAPLDAEDRDNFEDNDGIPDPDNDGDGIPDHKDKCPGTDETVASEIDTKEDMDGFQDEDGCPDPDNDNDGIPDVDDECPNEAETFNEYEDNDGCPDKKPMVEKGAAIILAGVNFTSGSSRLTENSKRILDKIVRTMQDNPEIEVEIRGYTDNTGSYNGNIRISQKRAESVRDYLVENGIAFSRILTKGFGPENPIAPNNTSEGRAKNRRIEFFRIK